MSSLYMNRQSKLFFFFFFPPGGADASGGWKPLKLLLFKKVVHSLENYFGPIFLLFDENKILVRVI